MKSIMMELVDKVRVKNEVAWERMEEETGGKRNRRNKQEEEITFSDRRGTKRSNYLFTTRFSCAKIGELDQQP